MRIKSVQQNKQEPSSETSTEISNFLFALKSSESKRQYPKRLKMFFDFDLDKNLSLSTQANLFLKQANNGKNGILWATQYFIRFLCFQKVRVEKGEISESTIPNYYKAAKLFCVMNDLILNWQKLGKGVPYEKKAADDRPPSFEEILKLLQYPDKRIKPIILIMISSGIRLGSFDYLRWKHIKPIKDVNGKTIAASLLVYATDQEEYDKLKTVFCKGNGWNLDYPHTVNVQSISLTGNYKWMPATDVEFNIEIEGQEKDPRVVTSNSDTEIDLEKENFKAK